jgi:hypothetical protein
MILIIGQDVIVLHSYWLRSYVKRCEVVPHNYVSIKRLRNGYNSEFNKRWSRSGSIFYLIKIYELKNLLYFCTSLDPGVAPAILLTWD